MATTLVWQELCYECGKLVSESEKGHVNGKVVHESECRAKQEERLANPPKPTEDSL